MYDAESVIDTLEEDIIILKEENKELKSEIDAKDLTIQELREKISELKKQNLPHLW